MIGAGVYFLACVPLYGRRGFPERDPFWLAMLWLWVPPVVLSAIYMPLNRTRAKHLLGYILVAAYIASLSTINMVPSYKGPFEAVLDLPLFAPLMLVGVLAVELAAQTFLPILRSFSTHPYCAKCGYLLTGLPEPRCPECGIAFSAEQLDSAYSPESSPRLRRRTTALVLVIVLLSLAWPFVYRRQAYASLAADGKLTAQEDWARGQAVWHVAREEVDAMTPEQQDRYSDLLFQKDPASGLRIDMLSHDPMQRAWQTSYRQVIEQKLHESGHSRPFD